LQAAFTVLGLALMFLLVFPLFAYAFKSNHIWRPYA
jgi:hypothetical protein